MNSLDTSERVSCCLPRKVPRGGQGGDRNCSVSDMLQLEEVELKQKESFKFYHRYVVYIKLKQT